MSHSTPFEPSFRFRPFTRTECCNSNKPKCAPDFFSLKSLVVPGSVRIAPSGVKAKIRHFPTKLSCADTLFFLLASTKTLKRSRHLMSESKTNDSFTFLRENSSSSSSSTVPDCLASFAQLHCCTTSLLSLSLNPAADQAKNGPGIRARFWSLLVLAQLRQAQKTGPLRPHFGAGLSSSFLESQNLDADRQIRPNATSLR